MKFYKNRPAVLEDRYENFLKKQFGMTFQEIMDLEDGSREKEEIEDKLWYILENDDLDFEASVLANTIAIKWGRYDNNRDL